MEGGEGGPSSSSSWASALAYHPRLNCANLTIDPKGVDSRCHCSQLLQIQKSASSVWGPANLDSALMACLDNLALHLPWLVHACGHL